LARGDGVVNKKALSESDICDRYITPALATAGWASNRWRREFGFTDGKIIVRGKLVARGKRKRLDYLLFHTPDLPIALIEAKDNMPKSTTSFPEATGIYDSGTVIPGRSFIWHELGDHLLLNTGSRPHIV
jgi:type I restriction enzyme R subunit